MSNYRGFPMEGGNCLVLFEFTTISVLLVLRKEINLSRVCMKSRHYG